MDRQAIAFAGVINLRQQLRDGGLTATELLEICLERIDRLNPRINCFIDVFTESARAEAVIAQKRIDAGEERPLLGIPVAIKDNFDVAGHVTAHGTGVKPPPATADAEVVRRIRAAGAIIIGKTALPEFAMWGQSTESKTWGVTRNPWNPDYSTGASSGGSAAAVASGMVPLAIATDGGGSVRIPSAACGLFGIKTTRGRVSFGPLAEHWSGLSVIGPLARSVADAALFLDAIAGPAPGDRDIAPAPTQSFSESAASDVGTLRIAVSNSSPVPGVPVKADRKQAVALTSQRLSALGHDVSQRKIRYPAILPYFAARYFKGIEDDADELGGHSLLEGRSRMAIRIGKMIPRSALARSRKAEVKVVRKMAKVFDEYDVLMSPTIAQRPQKADRSVGRGWLRSLIDVTPYVAFTTFWNFTGQPAVSVPVGFDDEGLPLAVQLIGKAGSEPTLIALAAQIERAHPWAQAHPPLDD